MKAWILLVFAGLGTLAGAAVVMGQEHNRSYENVSKVQVGQDKYVWINVKGNYNSAHGCGNQAFARMKNQLSDPRTEAQWRIAVASFLSKKNVHIWTVGCTGGPPELNYPIITQIQIHEEGVTPPSGQGSVPPVRGRVCQTDQKCCEEAPGGGCLVCVLRTAVCNP